MKQSQKENQNWTSLLFKSQKLVLIHLSKIVQKVQTPFLIILGTNCTVKNSLLTVSFAKCSTFPKGLEPGKKKTYPKERGKEGERERNTIHIELSSLFQIVTREMLHTWAQNPSSYNLRYHQETDSAEAVRRKLLTFTDVEWLSHFGGLWLSKFLSRASLKNESKIFRWKIRKKKQL